MEDVDGKRKKRGEMQGRWRGICIEDVPLCTGVVPAPRHSTTFTCEAVHYVMMTIQLWRRVEHAREAGEEQHSQAGCLAWCTRAVADT
nr:hypothetical protein CFP56_11551 [Quercus suber]